MPPDQPTESSLRKALELDPDGLNPQLDLADFLVDHKRFAEAEPIYARVLETHPHSPAAWHRFGKMHLWAQREAEAERCFRQALTLNEGYTRARYSLSYLLMRQGRFQEGWRAMEARPWNVALTATVTAPRWQGEPLAGKSLLIGQEGGFGDMLQFCRYVPLLKARGAARIGLVCQPALKRLLGTVPGLDVVLAMGEAIPDPPWDLWTLPFTLPLHCGTELATIPAPIPYLSPSQDQVEAWRARVPAKGLRLGLAWRGEPRFENDADRSLPHLGTYAPLAALEGITCVSLQIGPGEDDPAPPNLTVLRPGAWLEDFADTAALLMHLDLVITVDSAVAHLAGALGRPCWVLLPHFKTDWRWLTNRVDSPWYPGTMRLFRQQAGEAWDPVVARVADALATKPGACGLHHRAL